MEINFDNWSNGEESNCRVVLVKGNITENGIIISSHKDKIITTCGKTTATWQIYSGVFKAVIELKRGNNPIAFNYKGYNRLLSLNFVVNTTDLCVIPLYVVCAEHDGRFQAPTGEDNSVQSAQTRIGLGTLLVQCLFAEKLRENGFPRKTFQVENDIDEDAPLCRVFHSQIDVHDARKLDQESLWANIGREIMTSDLGSDRRKYLAILSCTHWDGSTVTADPALGGGGLALLGSATLHTWPVSLGDLVSCFTDQRRICNDLLDNSCFRGTYAGCLSTSLGAVCHEVGHMFNLGHTPTGIMSRGFDNVERVFLSVPSPEVKGRVQLDKTNNFILMPCLSVIPGPCPPPDKSGRVQNSPPKDNDLTTFTSACAAILAHHEWFNSRNDVKSTITYDPIRNIVSSDVGLKVVQLRGSCGSVVKSWELGKKSLNKHLILPRLKVSPATLVAINSYGYILTLQI